MSSRLFAAKLSALLWRWTLWSPNGELTVFQTICRLPGWKLSSVTVQKQCQVPRWVPRSQANPYWQDSITWIAPELHHPAWGELGGRPAFQIWMLGTRLSWPQLDGGSRTRGRRLWVGHSIWGFLPRSFPGQNVPQRAQWIGSVETVQNHKGFGGSRSLRNAPCRSISLPLRRHKVTLITVKTPSSPAEKKSVEFNVTEHVPNIWGPYQSGCTVICHAC